MTIAMQRARPIRITPTMSSGWFRKKTTASANISTGPITQFCTSDSPSTLTSRSASPSSSYFTFASGGYIIRINPIAIGMLVCDPSGRSDPIQSPTAGAIYPSSTPAPIARKIHSVKNRSRNDSLRATPSRGIIASPWGAACSRPPTGS